MEEKMTQQEIVESYFEDYFGHDLFETLTNEEVAEAIITVNKLADSINEYFGLIEDKDEAEASRLAKITAGQPDEHGIAAAILAMHQALHAQQASRRVSPARER